MAGQPVRQRIVVPFAGHVIGEGFNSETVERVGTALAVGSLGDDPIADGQTAVFKFHMVTSQASLEKALNFGAEVEARYGLFSGGGKFSFAESSAINSTSTYIVASCKITNALRFGSGFTPTPAADALIRAGDVDGFKRAFGDRFTQALRTGGEFHALVRITSSNVEHQRRIAASLHAELNGLTAGVGFQASLQTAQTDTSSRTEVDIQIHQTGGVGDQIQIPGTEADRIREHMNRFAAAAHDNAAAYEAELLTYDTLALPFPTPLELQDRRLVLEDCLAQRQQYWSAISDLTFAQSEDAQHIFQDLPPAEELVELQNAFRSALSGLMAHARAVSTGAIPPTLFVPSQTLVLPRFKRRTASSFATWWARRDDPTLLNDEHFLIDAIASAATPLLAVPPDQASPETMERAADMIEELSLSSATTPGPLRSAAALPSMIEAPLRKVFSRGAAMDDLAGLEPFSRLEVLLADMGALRDISALAAAAGLRELYVRINELVDLSPLRALTSLEVLCVAGNRIQSLDPLGELHALRKLSLVQGDFQTTDDNGNPLLALENPISDARALAKLPRLANPLTTTDRLRLTIADLDATVVDTGHAVRIGDTNRFQYTSQTSGASEQVVVMGLAECNDLNLVPAPVVAIGVLFSQRSPLQAGMAGTRPGDPSTMLTASELRTMLLPAAGTVEGLGLVLDPSPAFLLEVAPA